MKDNQVEDDVIFISVRWRKKKRVENFIDLRVPVEHKVTVLTVPPSNSGGKNKENEKKKK